MRHTRNALALSLLAAMPAFAQSFQPGLYLSADVGRAQVSSDYVDSTGDYTLGGTVGYQYTPVFGFEIYARGLSLNPLRGVLVPAGYFPDTHYGIAAVATARLDENFRFFGRLGVGRTQMKGNRSSLSDRDDTDPLIGVGIGYAFNRNWSLNLEGSYLTNSNVTLGTVGVRYQF
ncbi:porin family protein [Duganella callida]|uniref:Porin family protein n=1 Tax=Duganella callida TaxID=2561932 RepID=A0A4Y9T3G7_9BURK|nr:porin family protein [Duganella callida]TFW31479.1 porin family protein [Duganella callida]